MLTGREYKSRFLYSLDERVNRRDILYSKHEKYFITSYIEYGELSEAKKCIKKLFFLCNFHVESSLTRHWNVCSTPFIKSSREIKEFMHRKA